MESAAVIGFSAAIGAFGGFFIPKAFGTSLHMTGSAEGALYVFIAYYLSCIVATLVVVRAQGCGESLLSPSAAARGNP